MTKAVRSEASVNVGLRDTGAWLRIPGSQFGYGAGAETSKLTGQARWTHFREKASEKCQTR